MFADGTVCLVRVLLSSTAGAGHLQPLVPIARAFQQLGHEILIVAPRSTRDALAATGLAYRLGEDPPESEAESIWSGVAALERREASRLIEREWFAGLCVAAMLPTMEKVVAEWRPDLVLRETCEYASAIVAERAEVRHAQVGISTAQAEASIVRTVVARELGRYHRDLAERIFERPYLTRFPATLDPAVYPSTLRYGRLDATETHPLPEWWGSMDAPLVYVTFGTVVNVREGTRQLWRQVIDALSGLDVRILATTGSSDVVGPDRRLPANVHVEQWVAQDDVLAEASVVVCHGGSGTTFGALAQGVPLVMLPMFADQPTNARLVQRAGAGLSMLDDAGSLEMNVAALVQGIERVREAVVEVLERPTYRQAAAVLAQEMKRALSVRDVAALLAEDR